MVTVIHYETKDPDIHFDMTERKENVLIQNLQKTLKVTRCSSEEWFGQDDPNYRIHHWNAIKRRS